MSFPYVIPQPTLDVGDRLEVYWPVDDKFYAGMVIALKPGFKHRIMYDDGDYETVELNKEKWLPMPPQKPVSQDYFTHPNALKTFTGHNGIVHVGNAFHNLGNAKNFEHRKRIASQLFGSFCTVSTSCTCSGRTPSFEERRKLQLQKAGMLHSSIIALNGYDTYISNHTF